METHQLSKDKIVARRQVNQHNIDCFTNGVASKLCTLNVNCYNRRTRHSYYYQSKDLLICNRCKIRNDIIENPDRAFIGYTPQLMKEFVWL